MTRVKRCFLNDMLRGGKGRRAGRCIAAVSESKDSSRFGAVQKQASYPVISSSPAWYAPTSLPVLASRSLTAKMSLSVLFLRVR